MFAKPLRKRGNARFVVEMRSKREQREQTDLKNARHLISESVGARQPSPAHRIQDEGETGRTRCRNFVLINKK
jgi:hypothetical protein